MKCIDISTWQPRVKYEALPKYVDAAIIRVGFTGYETHEVVKDNMFEEHYAGLKKVGLPVGAYFYAGAVTVEGVIDEAEKCLAWLKGKTFELPIYYDMEAPYAYAQLTAETRTKYAKLWLDTMKRAGHRVGVYANLSWALNGIYMDVFDPDVSVWIAQYHKECEYPKPYDIWQYTSEAKLPAVCNGDLDMNEIVNPDIIQRGPLPDPDPAPELDIEKLAQEIIEGKWGNGEDRVRQLSAAGYTYEQRQAIQDRVNELMEAPVYVVEPGDTLSGVAQAFGTTWQELAKINGLENPDLIYPGQKLRV